MKYIAYLAFAAMLVASSVCYGAGIPGTLTVLQPDRTESSSTCLISVTDNFIAASCAASNDVTIVNEVNSPITGFSDDWKYGWFQAPPASQQQNISELRMAPSKSRASTRTPDAARQRTKCLMASLSIDDAGVNIKLYCPPV